MPLVNSDAASVSRAISRLDKTIETAYEKLLAISEEDAMKPPLRMKWSRKEILGHLIDSASNNHNRFVRAQFQKEMTFPCYAQEQWVAAQGNDKRPWTELIELWRLYNRHLVHIMRRVPPSAFDNVCVVSEDEPTRLADHLVDYVDHLEHHLGQIRSQEEG